MVAIGIASQIVLFAVNGEKVSLLSWLLLFAVAFLFRRRDRFGVWMLIGATSLVLTCAAIWVFFNLDLPFSVFVRRLIMTPGLLSGFYFEFFSANPKALLGHSILRGIVSYPYSAPPPFVIGSVYYGDERMCAVANVFADGFANFGYVGVLTATFLLAAILWLYDSIAARRDLQLSVLLIAVSSFSLSNTGLLTTILTHGLALVVLILYLIPCNSNAKA